MPERTLGPKTTVAMKSPQEKYGDLRIWVQLRHLRDYGAPKDPSGKLMVPVKPLPPEWQPKPPQRKPGQDAHPKSPKLKKQKRTCLSCGQKFASDWNGNRICRSCRTMAAGSGFLEGVTG